MVDFWFTLKMTQALRKNVTFGIYSLYNQFISWFCVSYFKSSWVFYSCSVFLFFAQNQDPGPVSISYSEDESAEVFLFATFVQLWSQTRSVFGQIELQEQSLILLFTILVSMLVELICRFSCLFFFFLLAYLVSDAIHKRRLKSFMIYYFSFFYFKLFGTFLFCFSSLLWHICSEICYPSKEAE